MVLARNELNIVETLLSSALSDFDISHEEFAKIIDEKIKKLRRRNRRNEEIKENIKNVKHENLDRQKKSRDSEPRTRNSEHRTQIELCKINFVSFFFYFFEKNDLLESKLNF